MAKKTETWTNIRGGLCSSELDALVDDVQFAIRGASTLRGMTGFVPHCDKITPELVAAIDALHEYAHRIKTEDYELTIAGVPVKSPTAEELAKLCDWSTTPVQCLACGQFGLHACPDLPAFIDPSTGKPVELDLATGIFRHCGVLPGDDWVRRVERLNDEIDRLRGEPGVQ